MNAPLALTTGEPAGIGPDLAVTWAQRTREAAVVAVAIDLCAARQACSVSN
jgi:4-hydroxy-L-threonine phosphate dehydrogenase PdxA